MIGEQTIRDVWRQQDIAKVKDKERWETEVAPHGVVLLKVSPGYTTERLVGHYRYRVTEDRSRPMHLSLWNNDFFRN